MTKGYVDDEVLKQAADSIIEDYKRTGNPLGPEQEAQVRAFVAGLVEAEPPTDEQIWETIEIVMAAIGAQAKEKALRAIAILMLQFISGCDHTEGAFQCIPILNHAKEAVQADRFPQAREFMMAFLTKCREAAGSM